jgi:predicted PurR-regulated permease PerM
MTISGFSFVIISIGLLIVHYHTPTLRGLAVFLLLFVPLGGLIITIGFIPFSKAIDDWQILREAKDRESKIEPK